MRGFFSQKRPRESGGFLTTIIFYGNTKAMECVFNYQEASLSGITCTDFLSSTSSAFISDLGHFFGSMQVGIGIIIFILSATLTFYYLSKI